ncbi:hypothetical protein RJ640_026334 [Escallonia rubra]|uniref:Peptide N-acetyl-beta-D-glucosaminyl asparaginase amidase A N-terminal domain-containing protein n=1 Tax=Escallonia rubra TaxID=112253 RepID=A0AA88RH10_9ASTE|nr:hypothetical protein RJ640_026334 [Escallonia rubra]
MYYIPFLLTTLLLLLTSTPPTHASPTPQNRFTKSTPLRQNASSQRYLELTHPLPTAHLTPSCPHLALRHNFGDTVGRPPVSVPYSPCCIATTPTWSHVVLEFRASCKGDQYDRIAAVWLAGAELLRTSTAEPTEDGIFWSVQKDVTKYFSLLKQSNLTLTVMLENVINDDFTGIYHVNVTFHYYNSAAFGIPSSHRRKLWSGNDQKLGLKSEERLSSVYETPSDLIIPISGLRDEGFWFRIQNGSDVKWKGIRIPRNTRKAVLEVYVSFHGNDEFWYSNPPDSYIQVNNLTTGRGHGAYREVLVTIDGNLVGSVVPFPVIFTGGINPLFWEPVVAIGAFDLPTYDFDLTPFLGLILDGKVHFFGLGVAESISFWLVDANLHLWLDHGSEEVQAKVIDFGNPKLSMRRKSGFKQLDGSFKIKAKRKSAFVGWVNSSAGNLTTHVLQDFKFKNSMKFRNNGTDKMVKQKVKAKSEVRVESDMGYLISRSVVQRRYPLWITTVTLPGSENDTYMMITNLSHGLKEKSSDGAFAGSVLNRQDSGGWMMVKDHDVLSGAANTHQLYTHMDEYGCYSRMVSVVNGSVVGDNTTSACG